MCLAVYIAGNKQLPLVEWVESNPSFYVSEISGYEAPVKRQFTVSYVYYVGSHEGCGCGFLKDGEFGEELDKVRQNYSRLAAYIKEALRKGIHMQLYSCWEGDQGSVPEFREAIGEGTLEQEGFEFKEKAFYQVTGGV